MVLGNGATAVLNSTKAPAEDGMHRHCILQRRLG
jgi:hypothetical protein